MSLRPENVAATGFEFARRMVAHLPLAPRLTVGVADDSPAMREGLARIIADECDLAFATSAANGAELRALMCHEPPRVLVMELMLQEEDGLALIRDLVGLQPATAIVVFTQQPASVYATRCLRAGARAFVGKGQAVGTLLRAIRETAAGGIVVPAGFAENILGASGAKDSANASLAATLTNRELQVFRLAGLAWTTRAIAARLGVSVKTVETHRENIKNKLGLDSHSELIAAAAQWVRESREPAVAATPSGRA